MQIKILILYIIIIISFSCSDKDSKISENAENAFSKIDKKNESLFTKEKEKEIIRSLLLQLKKIKNPLMQKCYL